MRVGSGRSGRPAGGSRAAPAEGDRPPAGPRGFLPGGSAAVVPATGEPEPPTVAAAHRLAGAASAYLRGAAGQPIAWYPWGPEPFREAARRHRPILLDIGAVWCHWCHVMDEGTYADAEVARRLAASFVAIKVDRDEHPEVDRRYQREVAILTGEGGWPLTAFLTPEGRLFLGGTYFPPEDGLGRPGFRRVLAEVTRLWAEEPERIEENARAVREALARSAASGAPATSGAGTDRFLSRVAHDLAHRADPVHGGFGHAPKFPHPTAIQFLLFETYRTGDPGPAARARLTLEKMADGGMYDQLGGGFHRYSVDEGWQIPHFEKMAVDNAALLEAYVLGARRFGSPRFSEVIRETVAWSRTVLGDPAGGFGTSQDADNAPGDDGGYFTWSKEELRAALSPDEYRLLTRYYGVGVAGQMPHDPERHVLYRCLPLAEAAEGLRVGADGAAALLRSGQAKLRAERARRAPPTVDRALYASVNGIYLRALAFAGQFLEDDSIVEEARRTADRFLREGYRSELGIAHRIGPGGPHGFGLLEDQAEFALGLTELAAVAVRPDYLAVAEALADLMLHEFRGEEGRLRDLAPRLYDGPAVGSVPEPSYPLEDTPHLSANAAAALTFVKLAALTGAERFREAGRALTDALAGRLGSAGLFAAGSALADGLGELPAARLVVEGTGPEADRLWRAAVRSYSPLGYAFRGRPPAPFSLPEEIAASGVGAGAARALVCRGMRCRSPITDPGEIPDAFGAPEPVP